MTCERKIDNLILLMGSNPLPNYIAARVLNPKEIVFFYSDNTKQYCDFLKNELHKVNSNIKMEKREKIDPSKAVDIRERVLSHIAGNIEKWHLNYTGGTKVMAANARLAFKEAGGKDEQASYIYENDGLLRFDDGLDCHLKDVALDLTFERVLALHGMSIVKEFNLQNDSTEGLKHARHKLSDKLSNPSADTGGEWLEKLAVNWIKNAMGDSAIYPAIYFNVVCQLPSTRTFEIDLAFVQGHRLFVASCSSSRGQKKEKFDECKYKMFEVNKRARQLGGDLARSALICLVDGIDENAKEKRIQLLRNDMESLLDSSAVTKVFGADDVREWEGINVDHQSYATLKEWLDS